MFNLISNEFARPHSDLGQRNYDYLCSGSHISRFSFLVSRFSFLVGALRQSVILPVVSGVLTAAEQYSYRPCPPS